MTWHHLPIVDVDEPREPFEHGWSTSGPQLRADLAAGRKILLHCLGGLGRTGTIATRLLVELGVPANEAIASVRNARPDTIETRAQEAHVRSAEGITDREPEQSAACAIEDVIGHRIPLRSSPDQGRFQRGDASSRIRSLMQRI
jgi:protein-tyrosine phosphatase